MRPIEVTYISMLVVFVKRTIRLVDQYLMACFRENV